jgi:phage/plasmid-like protein (TIGR03299 family)
MTTTDITPAGAPGRWVALEDRDNPWNILGQYQPLVGNSGGGTVEAAFTAEAALEATGLNFFVKKFPVHLDMSRNHDGSKMLHRKDLFVTGIEAADGDLQSFGVVSDKYEIVQPAEALSVFDEIVGIVDGAHYSAAWYLPEKARMGVVIELPDVIHVDPGGADDRVTQHMLCQNSFDGSTGLAGVPIPTRLGCTNQVPFLLRSFKTSGFTFRHTKNVKSRATEARRLLETTLDYFASWDTLANSLYRQKMNDKAFERFLESCTPFKIEDTMGDLTKERVRQRRADAIEAWRAPHNENVTGTRWGALNVVTEYAQWGRTVQGSSRTGTDARRQRAIGTMVHPDIEKWGREALQVLAA